MRSACVPRRPLPAFSPIRSGIESIQRSDLEHLIRASGEIAGDTEIIVIGSQAILGQFPDAPVRLLASMEADVFPKNRPEASDRIDSAIGEASSFHELHGYYAQGVGFETAVLPDGWQDRLIPINNENTNGIIGLCLEVHDLAVSKLVAGRVKDLEFVQALVRYAMVVQPTLAERLNGTDVADEVRALCDERIKSLFTGDFASDRR